MNNSSPTAAPPIITHLEPRSGPRQGGTIVTAHGSGFTAQTQLVVGGNAAFNVLFVDARHMRFMTPPLPSNSTFVTAPADVTATNADGQGSTLAGGFTFEADR